MRKRTWDIIARYVSEEHGIKIVISPDCPGPVINLETMTISLPERIKEQNALAALSSLIHEAAHMKYSTIIPKNFAKTNIDHHILNAMEDVRIDRKNFDLLPNIYDFYLKFIKEHLCTKENKQNILKQHMLVRTMISLILEHTYFGKYGWDNEAVKYINDHNINQPFVQGVYAIEMQNWDEVQRCIDEIKSKFNLKGVEKQQVQIQVKMQGGGNGKDGQGSGNIKADCKGDSSGSGQDTGTDGKSPGAAGGKKSTGDNNSNGVDGSDRGGEIGDPEEFLRPNSVWGKGGGLKGPGGLEFNPVELQETTKRRFIETLNMKERYVQSDGSKLDTDNLLAFFTGEINELFKEECVEKVKRSKIVFCLDASSSMNTPLFDKTRRKKALGKTIKSLIEILDEVRETEGLNVDYDIVGFNACAYVLDKENWEQEYNKLCGGTSIYAAVDKSIRLLSDSEIDGNKLFILVTDGEVSTEEIEQVKQLIMKNNSEIKGMLIGIGASQRYADKLCGDNNILFLEHADQIVMESIQAILED